MNPPYPYRDRSKDHLTPWTDDQGTAWIDNKPAYTQSQGKPQLIYPVTRKALQAVLEQCP